jgi:uncharacterized cupredoxin-like copper-binding protein
MIAVKSKSLSWLVGLPLILAMPAVAAENTPAARAVTVIATEYRFLPSHLAFKRGQAYRLHLENRGKETHEFTAPDFFASIKLGNPDVLNADKSEIVIQPGETKDLRFVAPKPGQYRFRCADHDWAGMTGDITVK